VYRLDEPARREMAAADPSILTLAQPPVLIDEWQHVPSVWDAVRRAVDRDATPNRFLLAGSAAPADAPRHSGAGRIVSLRMRPLSLPERALGKPTVSLRALLAGSRGAIRGKARLGLRDYAREIVASGFPGMRHLTGRAHRAQLDGYLRHIVDRDFVDQGLTVRRPDTLRRWMAAYAAATATTASLDKIRNAASSGEGDAPAKPTVITYRDVLERLWIVDPLPGWLPSRNQLGRLTQAPKHHLADPALAARLLGVDDEALLTGDPPPGTASISAPRGGTLLGRLFESLVTLSVRVAAQAAEARVRHFRTKEGRQEIDLIVERQDQRVVAIEVKLGAVVTDDDVAHLHWLRDQIGDGLLDAVVVTTGPEAYRRSDGVAVVPAALLGV
jgi:predicted AAA+ superfamily ATPase